MKIFEIIIWSIAMFMLFGGFNAYVIQWKLEANHNVIKSKLASKIWHKLMWFSKIILHLFIARIMWMYGYSWTEIVGVELILTIFSIPFYDLFINIINFPLWYIDNKGINKTILSIVKKKWLFWVLRFIPGIVGLILIFI